MLCLYVGKSINAVAGGLPGSLYGMLLFAVCLSTGKLDEEQVGMAVTKAIYYMPIVFLPVCIGVMQYLDLFARMGWQILVVGITATMIGILLVTYSSRWVLERQNSEDPSSPIQEKSRD